MPVVQYLWLAADILIRSANSFYIAVSCSHFELKINQLLKDD